MAAGWQTDGVDASGPASDALRVSITGLPFTLRIRSGDAKLTGFHYRLDQDQTVLFAENSSTEVRVDRLVLKLDRETNSISLKVKQGGPGSLSPPPVDRSWDSPEIPIAIFTIRANSDTVVASDLTDTREFVSTGVQMLSAASATTGARQLEIGEVGYDPTVGRFYARSATHGRLEFGQPPPVVPRPPDPPTIEQLLASTPRVKVVTSGQFSYQDVAWSGATWNIGAMWDIGNPSRIIISKSGLYTITAHVDYFGWAGGYVATQVDRITGSTRTRLFEAPYYRSDQTDHSAIPITNEVRLLAGDQVVVYCYSGPADLKAEPKSLSVRWVAP
ncbi:hypothetical protein GCM10009560_79190 [Nonomuraea longicatena]|uniref:Uncharacterized protein n=2 Tax=Nonomuraea longicatena TaxID=83682 RepID=A0ABP4BV76_9ACTN